MNRNVPSLVIAVEVVDMTPPCRNALVSLPHVEHLAGKFGKVEIIGELGLRAVIGRLLEAAPGIKDVACDVK